MKLSNCASIVRNFNHTPSGASAPFRRRQNLHRLAFNGSAVGRMLHSLAAIADKAKGDADGTPISKDYVLGPHWIACLDSIVGLLQGPVPANLDRGLCKRIAHAMVLCAGYDRDVADDLG